MEGENKDICMRVHKCTFFIERFFLLNSNDLISTKSVISILIISPSVSYQLTKVSLDSLNYKVST